MQQQYNAVEQLQETSNAYLSMGRSQGAAELFAWMQVCAMDARHHEPPHHYTDDECYQLAAERVTLLLDRPLWADMRALGQSLAQRSGQWAMLQEWGR